MLLLAFTGHRPNRIPDNAHGWVRAKLRAAIDRFTPDQVLSGMAQGTDLWAAQAAVDAGVPLVCYLPCWDQSARWPLRARSQHAQLLAAAHRAVVVYDGPCSAGAYHARNRRLVDESTGPLVAVWDGAEEGGTWATVRYAQRRGRRVAVIDPAARHTYWLRGR